MDFVRSYADHCLCKTMQTLPESTLYTTFFTVHNYSVIISRLETAFDIILEDSYRHDVLDAMLKIFTYHPRTLDALNDLVIQELTPKLCMLKNDQIRYKTNVLENQNTRFLHLIEKPMSVCHRKESLSFIDAVFGTNERNANAFKKIQNS